MSELEREVERLISEKKNAEKKLLEKPENTNQLLSVEATIATKELSAKIAREKRDKLIIKKNISNLEEIKSSGIKLQVIKNNDVVFKKNRYSKRDLIDQLRAAKVAHKRQMAFMNVLIETGIFHEVKATYPVNYANCDFGKWFCNEGLMLASFTEYKEIEIAHQKIHDYYLKIYNLFKDSVKSFLSLNKKNQLKKRDQKIKIEWLILQKQSSIFFDKVLSLEDKIKTLSNQEMANLNLV